MHPTIPLTKLAAGTAGTHRLSGHEHPSRYWAVVGEVGAASCNEIAGSEEIPAAVTWALHWPADSKGTLEKFGETAVTERQGDCALLNAPCVLEPLIADQMPPVGEPWAQLEALYAGLI